MASYNILCVHRVGHGDDDPQLVPTWTDAITKNIQRWDPDAVVIATFFATTISSITRRWI